MTDICSGWTENRAVWNKGAIGVVEQIKDIEKCLPFDILGFDCDNGSEFLNWHLMSKGSSGSSLRAHVPIIVMITLTLSKKTGPMLDKFLAMNVLGTKSLLGL